MEGTVKFYVEAKGYGFIIGEDGNEYFIHVSNIKNRETLAKDQTVNFEARESDKGKQAFDVVKI